MARPVARYGLGRCTAKSGSRSSELRRPTVAVRYDHYSDFGGTTNPKFTLRWQPSKEILLRGSYGTGFLAPTLSDLFQPQSLQLGEQMVPDPDWLFQSLATIRPHAWASTRQRMAATRRSSPRRRSRSTPASVRRTDGAVFGEPRLLLGPREECDRDRAPRYDPRPQPCAMGSGIRRSIAAGCPISEPAGAHRLCGPVSDELGHHHDLGHRHECPVAQPGGHPPASSRLD